MKKITTKYYAECRWCGTAIREGEEAWWERGGGVGHINCLPSDDPAADAEYYAGRAEGALRSIERELYGPELAEEFAMADELAAWNRGDDY